MTFKSKKTPNYDGSQRLSTKDNGLGGRFYRRTYTAPFDPESLGSLLVWLKAEDVVGLNDNDTITLWNDSSGNGYNIDSYYGTPKWKSSVASLNGRPAVYLDGYSYMYRNAVTSLPNGSSPFTLYTVGTLDGASTPDYAFLFGFGDNYGPYRRAGFLRYPIYGSPSDFFAEFWGTPPTTVPDASFPKDTAFSAAYAYVAGSVPSTNPLYFNGVSQGPSAGGSVLNISSTCDLAVGVIPDSPYYIWKGNISECMLYNATHTPTQISQVCGYLADKYGII